MVTYASHAAALREAGERSGMVGARASGDDHGGASAYQRTLRPEAEHDFAAASRTQQTVRPVVDLLSSIALALVLQARGARAGRGRCGGVLRRSRCSRGTSACSPRPRRPGRAGEPAGPEGAALERTEHAPQPAELQEWMNYSTSTTYLKALIVGDRDLAAARAGCARLLAFAERVHNRPLTIVLLGLQAMALDASGGTRTQHGRSTARGARSPVRATACSRSWGRRSFRCSTGSTRTARCWSTSPRSSSQSRAHPRTIVTFPMRSGKRRQVSTSASRGASSRCSDCSTAASRTRRSLRSC